MKNLNAFKALIGRYRSVTIEEINKEWAGYGMGTAEQLTGFGYMPTCSLCIAAGLVCIYCVYSSLVNSDGENDPPCVDDSTYRQISNSLTPQELLTAFRNRADYMENLLKQHNL